MKFLTVHLIFNAIFSQECDQIKRRIEVREMSPEQWYNYTQAFFVLTQTNYGEYEIYDRIRDPTVSKFDKPDKPEKYIDRELLPHIYNHNYAHGTVAFLPWHRAYIWNFEKKLQAINPEVTIPYWDWSIDYYEPHKSIVLTDSYFGTESVLTPDGSDTCLADGAFSYSYRTRPKYHCLKRRFMNSVPGKPDEQFYNHKLPSFCSPEHFSGLISSKIAFEEFSFYLEDCHNFIHNHVGGADGDLHPGDTSPNDPLFWSHHAFLDRLWDSYQQKNPQSTEGNLYNYPNRTKIIPLNSNMATYSLQVKDVFNTKNSLLCYDYEGIYNPGSVTKDTSLSEESVKYVDSKTQVPLDLFSRESRSWAGVKLVQRASKIEGDESNTLNLAVDTNFDTTSDKSSFCTGPTLAEFKEALKTTCYSRKDYYNLPSLPNLPKSYTDMMRIDRETHLRHIDDLNNFHCLLNLCKRYKRITTDLQNNTISLS